MLVSVVLLLKKGEESSSSSSSSSSGSSSISSSSETGGRDMACFVGEVGESCACMLYCSKVGTARKFTVFAFLGLDSINWIYSYVCARLSHNWFYILQIHE